MIVQAGGREPDAQQLRFHRTERALVARFVRELASPQSKASEPGEQR